MFLVQKECTAAQIHPGGGCTRRPDVPGHAGGWIHVRDAVTKALPKDVPMPGKFRVKGDGAAPAVAEEQKEG